MTTKRKAVAPTQSTPTKKSKAGRPAGGGEPYDLNVLPERDSELTRCKKCGSTSRSAYFGITRTEYAGRIIVRKRTKCLVQSCGQLRIDRHEESLPQKD